jgi:uncharacterized protein (TIGR00730 family)
MFFMGVDNDKPVTDQLTGIEDPERFRVAIFGSARIREGTPEYILVYDLALLIAAADMDLVTGGGPGLMEAASNGYFVGKKGSSQHSIGLQIKLPKPQPLAAHLDVKKEFDHFSERLDNFVALSNAFVVTPGGIGTMLELLYTWQLAQVRQMTDRPIILLGEMWFGLVQWIREWPLRANLLSEGDMDLIYVAGNIGDAFAVIEESCRHFKEGGKDFCHQYQEYRLKQRP